MTSRSKGASGERELSVVIHQELQDLIDRPERNLNQTRDGGHDLTGLPGVAVECKRVENLQVDKWWEQACRQAATVSAEPVLAYRQSRKQWTFVMAWSILGPEFTDMEGYFLTGITGFGQVYRRFCART